jgi:glycosyltransferase involved in cell wall biosynthesis
MVKSHRPSAFVLYTAVLPPYRRSCLEIVDQQLGVAWAAFAGDEHLDRTVRTDLPSTLYTQVTNHRWLGGRFLFQWGHWREAVTASTAILDLNPRSVTSWMLLLIRRGLRRRTLLWGHLDPRKGQAAPTARLRAAMRELAHGCIVYTYENADRLRTIAPTSQVWVAPNALYPRSSIAVTEGLERTYILYVGRLEPAKKPRLLLEAFAELATIHTDWELVMVGDGTLRPELEVFARIGSLAGRVRFSGSIHDVSALTELYAHARCSVSPGFVGLMLTQSLGFGVPMVVADDEPHSPEIELARQPGAVVYFERDSVASLVAALQSPELELRDDQRAALSKLVKNQYSAEAMAQGLVDAVVNVPQKAAA